jgi:hypothetical protein
MSKKERSQRQVIEYGVSQHGDMVPAIKTTPEWYKKIPRKAKDSKGVELGTVKTCIPFLDALTTGYHIVLDQDIFVDTSNDGMNPTIRYNIADSIGVREPVQTHPMPSPHGYVDEHYVWKTKVGWKLPEGYSAVYCHPLNRFDLPFWTVSGIVDADAGISRGNIPFYLKEGFSGVIKKGTPILQIIPFKREDWVSKHNQEIFHETQSQSDRGPHDWYRKWGWKKKSYK